MKWPDRWPCTPWANCTPPWPRRKARRSSRPSRRRWSSTRRRCWSIPKNYMAANDLGVLLAQCGNYADARTMLEHSLSLCPQSTSWQNLAVVYRQLGQTALAEQADRQAALLRQAETGAAADDRRQRPTTRCSGSIRRPLPRRRRTRRTRPARLPPPVRRRTDRRSAGRAPPAASRRRQSHGPAHHAGGGRANVVGIAGRINDELQAIRP